MAFLSTPLPQQPGVAAPPAALFHAGEVARTPPVLRAYPGDTVQVRVRSELPNHVKVRPYP